MTSSVTTVRTGPALVIAFNQPDRLNALTTEMLTLAAEAVEDVWNDTEIRVIVLTGAGQAFSSGADLVGNGDGGPDASTIDAANRLTNALRQVPKPVVAAVNGPAVGLGCALAVAADITIASESAYFLLAYTKIGLMPDGGATALIPAKIGMARASRMAMLAERIAAPLAVEWGLISHTVPDADFDAEVERITALFAQGPTAAFVQTKHALNATSLALLESALHIEREGQIRLFDTHDFAEGVDAFKGKRISAFIGK